MRSLAAIVAILIVTSPHLASLGASAGPIEDVLFPCEPFHPILPDCSSWRKIVGGVGDWANIKTDGSNAFVRSGTLVASFTLDGELRWEHEGCEAGADLAWERLALAGPVVVTAACGDWGSAIVAYDANDGGRRWTALTHAPPDAIAMDPMSGSVVTVARTESGVLIEALSSVGSPIWTKALDFGSGWFDVEAGGGVVVVARTSAHGLTVQALDADLGELLWSRDIPDSFPDALAIALSTSTVALAYDHTPPGGTREAHIATWGLRDGGSKGHWSFASGATDTPRGLGFAADGSVLFVAGPSQGYIKVGLIGTTPCTPFAPCASPSFVAAVDPENGAQLWLTRIGTDDPARALFPMSVAVDGERVVVGGWVGGGRAINEADPSSAFARAFSASIGIEVWRAKHHSPSPLEYDRGTALVASHGRIVLAGVTEQQDEGTSVNWALDTLQAGGDIAAERACAADLILTHACASSKVALRGRSGTLLVGWAYEAAEGSAPGPS